MPRRRRKASRIYSTITNWLENITRYGISFGRLPKNSGSKYCVLLTDMQTWTDISPSHILCILRNLRVISWYFLPWYSVWKFTIYRTVAKCPGLDSPWDPLKFSGDVILPALGPLSLWQKRTKGISVGVKCGRRLELTTLLSCAECQSKDVSPILHSLSKSSWLITGKLYLYLSYSKHTAFWLRRPTSSCCLRKCE